MSRERILESIRQSLRAAPLAGLAHAGAPAEPPPAPEPADLVAQFTAELEAVGGMVRAEPAAGVAARIVEWARARDASTLLAWDQALVPVPGLLEALRAAGLEVLDGVVPRDPAGRAAALAHLERATLGVTGADAALADTGTLALRTGPGRPRLASLSVRTHIALFTRAQLHTTWAAWLRAQGGEAAAWLRQGSSLTLITGPSRTADIEMTLTIGVHGPREVIAVLVE